MQTYNTFGGKEVEQFINTKESTKLYFLKLIEEVGELSDVIRKDRRLQKSESIKGTIEEELYDVLYYTLAIANVYDIDLETCFKLKEEINKEKWNK
ncbi:MAG: MazG nucleotide pyrophosphohydrolase domain-containing protein [Bacillota bacterium]